jgi:hypothetical protein
MRKIISLLVLVFATSMQSQNTEVQKEIESFFEGQNEIGLFRQNDIANNN